jgi:hypothetical protein
VIGDDSLIGSIGSKATDFFWDVGVPVFLTVGEDLFLDTFKLTDDSFMKLDLEAHEVGVFKILRHRILIVLMSDRFRWNTTIVRRPKLVQIFEVLLDLLLVFLFEPKSIIVVGVQRLDGFLGKTIGPCQGRGEQKYKNLHVLILSRSLLMGSRMAQITGNVKRFDGL